MGAQSQALDFFIKNVNILLEGLNSYEWTYIKSFNLS